MAGFMRSSVVRENDDPIRSAKHFLGSGFSSGAVLSVASVEIEDECVTVFAGDLDRLAGFCPLVEEVESRLRIVVWNPFADGRGNCE